MAYNPTSSWFGYHEHNRKKILINFYTTEVSSVTTLELRNTRFFHGLGMFLTWWYVLLTITLTSLIITVLFSLI